MSALNAINLSRFFLKFIPQDPDPGSAFFCGSGFLDSKKCGSCGRIPDPDPHHCTEQCVSFFCSLQRFCFIYLMGRGEGKNNLVGKYSPLAIRGDIGTSFLSQQKKFSKELDST